MRLAIFTEGYFPELSGVTTSLYQRLHYLSQWGHEVRLYAPDYSPLAHLYPNYREYVGEIMPGITVRPFPGKPYYVDYTRDPKPFSLGALHAEIERFRPDVIHAECPERLFLGFLGRPGISLARRLKIPATAIYHTNYLAYVEDYKKQVAWLGLPGMENLLRKLVVSVYNSYAVTMVATPIIRDYLASHGVRNTHLHDFYGVNIHAFHPQPTPPNANTPPKILYIGRMTPDKQIDTLLEALTYVRQSCPDCPFILMGGGPEEEKVRHWLTSNGPGEQIGRVPFKDLPSYYWKGDIFVTASPKENRPLTILEAMASGLPIVAPAGGGIPDIVVPEKSGLLVPPDDARALAEALIRLVKHPELRQAMGKYARQTVEQFSWEASTRAMVQLWEELCAQQTHRR